MHELQGRQITQEIEQMITKLTFNFQIFDNSDIIHEASLLKFINFRMLLT